MNRTNKTCYMRHRYSGPRPSWKRIRGQLGTSRAKAWRCKKTKKPVNEDVAVNNYLDTQTDGDNTQVCDSPESDYCIDEQEFVYIILENENKNKKIFVQETKNNKQDTITESIKDSPPGNSIKDKPILCKLSNALDILSDDEEEPPKEVAPVVVHANEKQCINIEDDDDVMLIDEDTSKTETQPSQPVDVNNKEAALNTEVQIDSETESTPPTKTKVSHPVISINENEEETKTNKSDLPLLPDNFLKTARKNLSDMTREELEEFCILKIVESAEINNKLKTIAQGIEGFRKKDMTLTIQDQDLQVVLKSAQEEQKKITRSVGIEVFTLPLVNQIAPTKTGSPVPNGIKTPSSSQNVAEERQQNRIMAATVNLTDEEPPAKINNETSPAPPVRLVPRQNLLASPARQPFGSSIIIPQKENTPIIGPQNQGLSARQTVMLKTVPTPGLKPRGPTPQISRLPSGTVRVHQKQPRRHPAPLPNAVKQYQPPNWKALPPAPDLKLSKIENGIFVSWNIEGYQEDSYEKIMRYQLYVYQETSSPASTALWKIIGDIKALPLPMECTLTQFRAGFKYHFAVRAVDSRSRLGPFSLPESILLKKIKK